MKVEKILGKKFVRGKPYYRVKWVGMHKDEATWNSPPEIIEARDLINKFEQKNWGSPVDDKFFNKDLYQSKGFPRNESTSKRKKEKNKDHVKKEPQKEQSYDQDSESQIQDKLSEIQVKQQLHKSFLDGFGETKGKSHLKKQIKDPKSKAEKKREKKKRIKEKRLEQKSNCQSSISSVSKLDQSESEKFPFSSDSCNSQNEKEKPHKFRETNSQSRRKVQNSSDKKKRRKKQKQNERSKSRFLSPIEQQKKKRSTKVNKNQLEESSENDIHDLLNLDLPPLPPEENIESLEQKKKQEKQEKQHPQSLKMKTNVNEGIFQKNPKSISEKIKRIYHLQKSTQNHVYLFEYQDSHLKKMRSDEAILTHPKQLIHFLEKCIEEKEK